MAARPSFPKQYSFKRHTAPHSHSHAREPVAVRRGVELRTRCRVRKITIDENGMADGVIYFDAEGIERRQKAEVVVR